MIMRTSKIAVILFGGLVLCFLILSNIFLIIHDRELDLMGKCANQMPNSQSFGTTVVDLYEDEQMIIFGSYYNSVYWNEHTLHRVEYGIATLKDNKCYYVGESRHRVYEDYADYSKDIIVGDNYFFYYQANDDLYSIFRYDLQNKQGQLYKEVTLDTDEQFELSDFIKW